MKNVLLGILALCIIVGLSYGFGWIGVHQTKTIGKAQKNADREVFEQTQSYVDAKRQEALKMYREYFNSDEEGKKKIKELVSMGFASFDEEKLNSKLRNFVYDCKYKN